MLTNYLKLSHVAKLSLVTKLQDMRDGLRKEKREKKATKTSRKRKMVFFSDEIEKMFNKMPKDMQDFIRKGK